MNVLGFLVPLVLAGPPAKKEPRRFALVVGNAHYRVKTSWSNLPNAKHDMKAVSRMLAGAGWEVTQLPNATSAELDAAVRAFSEKLGSGDIALFYYSGHGQRVDGYNKLISVPDASGTVESVLLENIALKLSDGGVRPGWSLLVIDACRSNAPKPKGPEGTPEATAPGFGIVKLDIPRIAYVFSTQPGAVADASDQYVPNLSPFTVALLEETVPQQTLHALTGKPSKNVADRTYKVDDGEATEQRVEAPGVQGTELRLIEGPTTPDGRASAAELFRAHVARIRTCLDAHASGDDCRELNLIKDQMKSGRQWWLGDR